jgi:hypothetical protein
MITCSKSLVLESSCTVPTPTVYYKMDAIGATTPDAMPGAVDATNLLNAFALEASGKISGCGDQINSTLMANTLLKAQNNIFKLSTLTVGMTWRLWYKQKDASRGPAYWLVIVNPVSKWAQADFMLYGGHTVKAIARANYNVGFNEEAIAAIPVDTDWHRIIATLDVVTRDISVQVDNGSVHHQSAALPAWSWRGDDILWIGTLTSTPAYTSYLDEIGYWRDYIFTDADRLCDWNDGDGVTFP